jgi:UDP-2,3-diacylglucosamine pyrophosphatase LpxH
MSRAQSTAAQVRNFIEAASAITLPPTRLLHRQWELELAIVSDTHMAGNRCHAKQLGDFLGHIAPDILIGNGDLLDYPSGQWWDAGMEQTARHPPTEQQLQEMRVVQSMQHMFANGTRLIGLGGNHDADVLQPLYKRCTLKGIGLHKNTVHTTKSGKNLLILHGDALDPHYDSRIAVSKRKVLDHDTRRAAFYRAADTMMGQYNQRRAVQGLHPLDAIVTGHIHRPGQEQRLATDGQPYTFYNSGDWIIPDHCTAVVLPKHSAEMRVVQWQPERGIVDYKTKQPLFEPL